MENLNELIYRKYFHTSQSLSEWSLAEPISDPRSGNPAILSAITQIFSIQSMRILKVILKEFLTSKDTADEKYFYNLQGIKRNQN